MDSMGLTTLILAIAGKMLQVWAVSCIDTKLDKTYELAKENLTDQIIPQTKKQTDRHIKSGASHEGREAMQVCTELTSYYNYYNYCNRFEYCKRTDVYERASGQTDARGLD